ncbi:hypothetical protein llap_8718 [Limosa lapponica baueri]|uniref:Uncharacterized protein n=1 Tax=Limosa lapponica baueri TaxID=1758121 RepID=A0A2I0U4P8_LIMLA|nr:hypothetical protein llap_8718 [Limosa lapponica baueri]
MVEQIIACSLWRTAHQSRWMPQAETHGDPVKEQAPGSTCGPVDRGVHTGTGLLAGLVTPWGPTLEQYVPEGLYPMERTHAGAVHEEL